MITKALIENFRETVKPFVSQILFGTNYEGMGTLDCVEFERDFDEILDLALAGYEQKVNNAISTLDENKNDMVYRQAAIDALDCINGVEEVLRSLPSVQPERTEERTETHACDLISRQDAIDALDVLCQEHRYKIPGKRETYSQYSEAWQDALDRAEGAIFNLPSAQPEPPWILCEERMPEEHEWLGTKKFGTTISDEVYVTFENEKGERFCQHMSFQNGELSSYDQFHMDTWYKGSKPIAWMPLPKPFEGGTE